MKTGNFFRRLLCKTSNTVTGPSFHRFTVVQQFDEQDRKLQCHHCKRYFAMSDRHRSIVPWDEEYEKIICEIFDLPRTNR